MFSASTDISQILTLEHHLQFYNFKFENLREQSPFLKT